MQLVKDLRGEAGVQLVEQCCKFDFLFSDSLLKVKANKILIPKLLLKVLAASGIAAATNWRMTTCVCVSQRHLQSASGYCKGAIYKDAWQRI